MKTTRPTKKLDYRNDGPFRVLTKISDYAYQLDIPPSWQRFDIFPVSLLRPYTPPHFPLQSSTPSSPTPPALDHDESIPSYRIAQFLNSRNNSETGKLEYLVEWDGLEGTAEQVSWQPPSDLSSDPRFAQAKEEFHLLNPTKPSTDTTPRPKLNRAKPKTTSSAPQDDFSPATISQISHPISSHPTSSPTTLPTPNPIRPKQPPNWKGWKLVPDEPSPSSSLPYDGPTSRSGRPLRRKFIHD
ncbi:hypothetical protein L198_04770 [Cryptococcus wingfieldii CBS 7118]|uniref:Chromo domain-containing protein n=1 Tax=Cryptococcus wingfieldii CBS 7118 TaxID=1295528 RepID=A0A1E3J1C9_9TREE|nr:hypothetical protein L198_04770 [Cryptococcus wingfieldii CBS 7118]ODN94632.1 hypothetical protein L198_04770 [Cryptococcus wingfieldii CBS 7118]